MKPHRDDFTADDLPEGYRALANKECAVPGDERLGIDGWSELDYSYHVTLLHVKHRTKRPTNALVSDREPKTL